MKINVIGAGIIGSALAWKLAERGANVTLIDKNPPGGIASAASFGWINAAHGNPKAYFDLRFAAMKEWHRLKDADATVPFRPDGTLILHYDTDHDTHFEAQAAWGYPIEWMNKDAISKAEPNLSTGVERGLFTPFEGQLDVDEAARYFSQRAESQGAKIVQRSINQLDLTQSDMTVLAAGTTSADLAKTQDINLPMTSPPGLLIYSKPLSKRVLFHTVLTDGLHIQQRSDGRLVAGADFGGGALNNDAQKGAEEIFLRMTKALPSIKLEYETYTLGLRPTPIDGLPIIGKTRAHDNLYITVMHSGATLAPIVAKLAGQEIMTGKRDPLLTPFGPDRFLKTA